MVHLLFTKNRPYIFSNYKTGPKCLNPGLNTETREVKLTMGLGVRAKVGGGQWWLGGGAWGAWGGPGRPLKFRKLQTNIHAR